MTRLAAFGLLLLMQALCALVFVLDILLSALGIYPAPLSWSTRELLEIGAGLGLFLGLILGTILVLRAVRDLNRAEARHDRGQQPRQQLPPLAEHVRPRTGQHPTGQGPGEDQQQQQRPHQGAGRQGLAAPRIEPLQVRPGALHNAVEH